MRDAPTSTGPPATVETGNLATWRRRFGPLLAIPTPVIFVSAAVLATFVLWHQGELGEIGASMSAVPPWSAISILLVYGGSLLALGVRWHVLVRLAGGAPAWFTSAEVFLTSVIVNYAAPIGLAVPTRAALTVRDLGLRPTQSGMVVGWELGLDMAALLAISIAWIASGGGISAVNIAVDGRGLVVAGVALLLAVAGGVLVARWPAMRAKAGLLLRGLLLEPLRRPVIALLAVGLTALFWSVQLGVMASLLAIFGVPPTPPLVLGIMGLPVLIGMLSPVPGGAGIREALMAAVAGLEGVPAAPVVLAAVSYRLALFVVTPAVWSALRLRKQFALTTLPSTSAGAMRGATMPSEHYGDDD